MAYVHSSVLAAPLAEVFAWHGRPGALIRLTPPWQPVGVIAEADTLRDGKAVLGLPFGLRWIAQHGDFEPPDRFADELTSLPVYWRHRHEFTEADLAGDPATRLTDRVDTLVPSALLRPMFRYRHRQLADDIATHRAFADRPRLTVAMTGSSGLVGTALAAFLTTGGHRVIRLVRRAPADADERRWQPGDPDPDLLDGVDVVVHLAGVGIGGRFTGAHRAAVRDSRVGPTRALAELAARGGPAAFVSASAIGYYGPDRGAHWLSEDSERGDGFLADLVADWEAATTPARDAGLRVVRVRTGIVQSARGGTLRLLRPLFAAGLGGRLGDGTQWLSWIGIDDLVDVYHRAVVADDLAGPVNAVAPNPVPNREYTAVLAKVSRRPAIVPVPRFGPRLLLGEQGAAELALAGQRVRPARLRTAGHRFRMPGLEATLRHQLGR
ncbi:MAG TPA: TIGR01777 family oxidoreductase [Pseudonocardiaceae bacterium]|nr:TIGR01777 family oxidoreductase [Pseudonocardiaceae bacterium]